ncbi:MAG: hypothetical protein ACI92E_002468 [Oceanicoccus sp.]|jgi:hypothetical protein
MDFTLKDVEELIQAREEDCVNSGVLIKDMELSRRTGIDPMDIGTFKTVAKELECIIVVRCPKLNARAFHGFFPPKPMVLQAKTNELGFVIDSKGNHKVSDYDLMSIYVNKADLGQPAKLFVSARNGLVRGKFSPLAKKILGRLNKTLVSRIQHGCQDDFHSTHNPGVKPTDFFAAFWEGKGVQLKNPDMCRQFYKKMKMDWVYDDEGHYIQNRRNQTVHKGRNY